MRERRYCVIGAGYSGLGMAKAFVDAGLDYDHFESTDHVGGNWGPRRLRLDNDDQLEAGVGLRGLSDAG